MAYANRGSAYARKGDDVESIQDFSQVILLSTKYAAFAYAERGSVYLHQGDYGKSIADCSQAILIDPKQALAYDVRSDAYRQTGDYDKAIADGSQAVQFAPNLALAYYNRGIAYELKGDYAKAVADYSQMIPLDPNFAMGYNDFAWLMATCPQAPFRDGRKAVEYATKACELTQWKEPFPLGTLAAACAEEGDFENAVKWQKQQLENHGLSASDIPAAISRLALYMTHHPYHTDK